MLKRPPYHRASVPLTPAVGGGVYARASEVVVAVPKGVKAKPGKRAPTVEEAKWMDDIVRFGCVACWLDGRPNVPAAVHHILRGGVRMGHLFTLPLCDPGHHQGGTYFGPRGETLISRHPYKARFEAKYGSELALLAMLKVKLGYFNEASYA